MGDTVMMKLNAMGRFDGRDGGPEFEGHAIYPDSKGYACIWQRRDIKLHVLIWERANGPKPAGHDIHHRDENKANFDLDNLELLTCADHQRLHAGWVKDAEGAWIAKPCTQCHEVLPLHSFYPRKGYTPSAKCKRCHNEAAKQWSARNPEKRREISRRWWERKGARDDQDAMA